VTVTRVLLNTIVVLTSLVLQLSVVNPLDLPGGGPDLVVLALAALAFVQGELPGAVTGFAAGLLLDLVPPADGLVGRWALVLCLTGYVAGRLGPIVRDSAIRVVAAVAGLAAGSVLAFAGLSLLFGDVGLTAGAVGAVALASAGYDVFLTPFVVPALMGLARRAEPETQRL
jgi:rod shape-determining protein MreD